MEHHDVSHRGKLSFVSHFEPPLEAGRYTLEVSQTLTNPEDGQTQEDAGNQSSEFVVSAPRFALAENDIVSHYPLPGGDAVYDGVASSLSFRRKTLLWERSPSLLDKHDGTAWLALILVDEDEIASGQAREIFADDAKRTRHRLKDVEPWLGLDNLSRWERYDEDLPMQILELDRALYDALLPNYGDLTLLSHARQNRTDQEQLTSELGTVLCNRLPTPGKTNTVYLVSVEHRFATTDEDCSARHVGPDPSKQRLVYLHRWRFHCRDAELFGYTITPDILRQVATLDPRVTCPRDPSILPWVGIEFDGEEGQSALKEQVAAWLRTFSSHTDDDSIDSTADALVERGKHREGTFPEILKNVQTGLLRDVAEPGASIPAEAKALLDGGHTVLKHHLRAGGTTFSWLKGALATSAVDDMGFEFPAASADDLLIFHESTGMFDTSYAAAWALGRLQGIERKSLSTELFRWRHDQLHLQVGHRHDHLPVAPLVDSELPADVVEQADAWQLLQGIPFEYLVPHPKLLPLESLRFFHLDHNWMRCFLDGFFSVGKVHGLTDFSKEQSLFPSFERPISGILLRSNAVAGWPAMHVNAYAQAMAPNELDPDASHIRVLRKERLQSEVLLLLFDGVPQTLDLYLSPEGLHSGFERADTETDAPRYIHRIRHPQTGSETTETEALEPVIAVGAAHGSPGHRTFSPSDVAQQLRSRFETFDETAALSAGDPLSAGDLGLQLLDKAPMVRYQLRSI